MCAAATRSDSTVTFGRITWLTPKATRFTEEFGAASINPSRHVLFRKITAHLRSRGLDPGKDIRSVFEVGCSAGYLLRHLEEAVFPSATILHGLDIDAYAVKSGMEYLSRLRSGVKLFAADMQATERIMGSHSYDLVLCCGVLMYVDESTAEQVVRVMFSRAGRLVGSDLPGSCRGPSRAVGVAPVRRGFHP